MRFDVVIVGGGIMGSSTAYHLMRHDPSLTVVVVERDDSYQRASTTLSDGNVRLQFGLEENIRISQHAMHVLETFAEDMATPTYRPEVGARHQGNLFLTDDAGRAAAMGGLELQRALTCDVQWMTVEDIESQFGPLRLQGLAGGTFSQGDGSVDPSAVLRGYRSKAIELGARYVEAEVSELLADSRAMRGVRLRSGEVLETELVVNAAGAWSADLARGVGVEIPVLPVMRTVYVVSTTVPTAGLPSLFLPSGCYALPESDTTWVMAWSREEDPVGYVFEPAGQRRFTDIIWPELHAHLPEFDTLRVESSWAGLYAVNTLDGNAIVGEWPKLRGLFIVTGFSGHGFQQAPAVGRYLSELILGLPHALDLHRLGPERVIEGRPLHEDVGRLI